MRECALLPIAHQHLVCELQKARAPPWGGGRALPLAADHLDGSLNWFITVRRYQWDRSEASPQFDGVADVRVVGLGGGTRVVSERGLCTLSLSVKQPFSPPSSCSSSHRLVARMCVHTATVCPLYNKVCVCVVKGRDLINAR